MDAATLAVAKAYANKRLNWRGAWAATTVYAKNDIVTFNGGLYRAPVSFTSGASFVIANWVELVQQSATVVQGGNLGPAQSLVLTAGGTWLVGTLTANLTVTVSGLTAGYKGQLHLTQDATGGRTLTITDGSTSQVVSVATAALSFTEVGIESDGTNLFVIVPGGTGAPIPSDLLLQGAPRAATPAAGDSSTRLATTAFVAGATGLPTTGAEPQWVPGLMMPAFMHGSPNGVVSASISSLVANAFWIIRFVAPQTGSLKNLHVFVGTSSGNIRAGVYDTGATAGGGIGTGSLLWESGSVALAGTNAWFKIGDPNVSVTAGQQIDVAVQVDNATATLARLSTGQAAQSVLPFGTTPDGALHKAFGRDSAVTTFVAFPSTLAEATRSSPGSGSALPLPILQVV